MSLELSLYLRHRTPGTLGTVVCDDRPPFGRSSADLIIANRDQRVRQLLMA